METNPMTDSELLGWARRKTEFYLDLQGYEDLKDYHLARFVADYLDDSPVTMEVLEQVAADSDGLLEMRNGQMWIAGWEYYFEENPSRGECTLWDNVTERPLCHVTTLSQLRHLLRGLGVGL